MRCGPAIAVQREPAHVSHSSRSAGRALRIIGLCSDFDRKNRGRKDREPVAKAEVIATGTGQRARTDDKGGFTLTLLAGEVELYVTTVGYGLVKKTVRVEEEP